jgi:predicted dehydrogenase
MKKVLIVGFGSIGQRHAANFKKINCSVSIVSRRQIEGEDQVFATLEEGVKNLSPEVVFICTETSQHHANLSVLADLKFAGQVIVEKPIFDLTFKDDSKFTGLNIRVSYNLRFHSLLQYLKNELSKQKIISAHVYVGQYLPTWRKNVDYRTSYSAFEEKGGGVLLDLSHELDYCQWLFGKALGVFSVNGHFSHLEISSMDTCGLLVKYEQCNMATIQLNYLDRITQRFIIVNTDETTYKVDLIAQKVYKNSDEVSITADGKDTYLRMSENILNQQAAQLTSYAEAVDLMKCMQAAVAANKDKVWKTL